MFLLDNASHFILVDRVTEPDRKVEWLPRCKQRNQI